jgi:hypothetical protein
MFTLFILAFAGSEVATLGLDVCGAAADAPNAVSNRLVAAVSISDTGLFGLDMRDLPGNVEGKPALMPVLIDLTLKQAASSMGCKRLWLLNSV